MMNLKKNKQMKNKTKNNIAQGVKIITITIILQLILMGVSVILVEHHLYPSSENITKETTDNIF